MDKAGATRAAGHKFHGEHTPGNATVTDVLSLAKAAKAAGRQVGHGGLFFFNNQGAVFFLVPLPPFFWGHRSPKIKEFFKDVGGIFPPCFGRTMTRFD